MQKTILFLFSFLCFTASAQKQITIEEAVKPMSKDSQPAFVVVIPQIKLADVEKDWLKYISTGSKGKASVVNGENRQPLVLVKNISPKPLSIYSKLLETSEGVKLTVWFTENDTLFISKQQNNDQALAIENYLRDFAVKEYQDVVKAELNTEQQIQTDLTKQLNALIKEQEKSAKKVSESNRAIQKSNDNIATNNGDIQSLSYKISDQKGMVERTASDANANKGAKQTLKDLENQKKKLQNQNKTESKNIDNMNKTIREEERKIADYKEKVIAQNAQIEAQKQKVAIVQAKLSDIK